MSAQVSGRIKTIRAERGFGFVRGDDGVEYFFHATACSGVSLTQLAEGDRVVIVTEQGERGPRASRLSLVPAASGQPEPTDWERRVAEI